MTEKLVTTDEVAVPTHVWRDIGNLADALAFVADKHVAGTPRETVPPVDEGYRRDWNRTGLDEMECVIFTDGTALAVVIEHGFRGSDVTPPDPISVSWYAYERVDNTKCPYCGASLTLKVVSRRGGTWVDRKCSTHGKLESLPSRFSKKAWKEYHGR